MSTRATIKIDGVNYAKIYKHWDGYPDGLLDWLKSFNERFSTERGIDPPYKFAQLLRDSVRNEEKFKLDKSEFTGWGVVENGGHGDCGEEFEYELHDDGKVTYEEIKF